MPECTKAEREYLDAKYAYDLFHATGDYDRVVEAHTAILAERRAAEQESVVAEQEATIGLTMTDWREQERLLQSRIAELEAALAEERAKPKKGATSHYARKSLDGTTWFVHKATLAWVSTVRPSEFTGPDAERHAREHAAKLQAEHDAKGGRP